MKPKSMTDEDEEFERIYRRIELETQPLINFTKQKEWVGLTEEEVKESFVITPDLFLPWQIYKRIEAKLKEKNYDR
jgi:hypothetical protein